MEIKDKNINEENQNRINEIKIPNSNLNPINILYDACKSTVKIISLFGIGSGFFIELEKNNKPFYCLMSNEHVITKDMIESKKILRFIMTINIKKYKLIWIILKDV